MVSSTNFKKIHDLYQSEGVSKEISIVHFCHMNGIVYKDYERWYKNNGRGKSENQYNKERLPWRMDLYHCRKFDIVIH